MGVSFRRRRACRADHGQAVVFAYADATIQGRGFPLLELRDSILTRDTSWRSLKAKR